MPELPEVETVRRMLVARVVGHTVASVSRSRSRLHVSARSGGLGSLVSRHLEDVGRRGKYLLFRFDKGRVMISHLGMSGRWLYFEREPIEREPHVHARLRFQDGGVLWFQDPRRFGQLRVIAADRLATDPSLVSLGRDPLDPPPTGAELARLAGSSRLSIKQFLLDQRRLAGIGNIYASEILFRAGVDPRRHAHALTVAQWKAVAKHIPAVLEAAIDRMGTTFSSYRTLSNEPGQYADRLLVYDREGDACRRCGSPVRRIVQGQRSTFFCPSCQRAGAR
jgi:formamidopyrimidine-DNA glycosylase